jgi:hypothetical protein
MSIECIDVCTAIRDAVSADATLENWAVSNAGGSLSTFLGVDPASLPGGTEAPYLAIYPKPVNDACISESQDPPSSLTGPDEPSHVFRIAVDLGAVGATQTAGNDTTYTGLNLVQKEFKTRVLDIARTISSNVWVGRVEDKGPVVGSGGLTTLSMVLTVTVPNLLGGTIEL